MPGEGEILLEISAATILLVTFPLTCQKTGDVYAVKVYTPRHRGDRSTDIHQEREFALLKQLQHENVVKMLAEEEEVVIQSSSDTSPS